MLRRITTSFIVLTLLAVSLAPLAGASASAASKSPKHSSKVAPELTGAASSQKVRVIILYSNGVVFANKPFMTNGIMLGDGIMITD